MVGGGGGNQNPIKMQVYILVASGKLSRGGGGAIWNPKKYAPLISKPGSATAVCSTNRHPHYMPYKYRGYAFHI